MDDYPYRDEDGFIVYRDVDLIADHILPGELMIVVALWFGKVTSFLNPKIESDEMVKRGIIKAAEIILEDGEKDEKLRALMCTFLMLLILHNINKGEVSGKMIFIDVGKAANVVNALEKCVELMTA